MRSALQGLLWPALRFSAVMTLLCGLAWPLATNAIGGALFPWAAAGSVIVADGRPVGSWWVAQPFLSPGYLIGRPSPCGHDPRALAGSNLAPSNPALRARVAADAEAIAAREGVAPRDVPPELVAASGSCVDPHVSPASAQLQVPRIARARGMREAEVAAVIASATRGGGPFDLGPARVHVLEVNLSLDGHDPK